MKHLATLLILILGSISRAQVVIQDSTPPPPPPPPQAAPVFSISLGSDESAVVHSVVAPLVAPANGWFPIRTVSVQIAHDPEGKPTGAQAIIVADIAPNDLEKVRAAIAPLWGMPAAVASRPIASVGATIATNGAARVTLTFK